MIHIYEERCKGCGYCVHFCPRDALQFSSEVNQRGTRYPFLAPERCIQCGVCYLVCPDCAFEMDED